jgi:hypothetical protein
MSLELRVGKLIVRVLNLLERLLAVFARNVGVQLHGLFAVRLLDILVRRIRGDPCVFVQYMGSGIIIV